ncbi:AAC(3) family N-acetyltransferase [soil metagenome]
MVEAALVRDAAHPLTLATLAEAFEACGLAPGQTVLVHSALSKLGWVSGGPVAVIEALLQVLGETGTLVMPAHSADNSEPSAWRNPPVPERWWPVIRATMPAFDPAKTPTRGMGRVPELFRTWPGVHRSYHPTASFAALGPQAAFITETHDLVDALGKASPLDKLYELDGYVFLLGVGHGNNTSLHLAETRANITKTFLDEGSAVFVDGARRWVEYQRLAWDDEDFEALGTAYEKTNRISVCKVGQAEVRLLRQRPLVDWAVQWLEKNRK